MTRTELCESCSFPIESGRYCQHCVDASGELQPFEERFEKMIAWRLRRKPELSRADAAHDTLVFMARMPAWKDHPRVKPPRKRDDAVGASEVRRAPSARRVGR